MFSNLVSRIVSYLKGEEYIIDPHIPASYIVQLLFKKGIDFLRGILTFRKISPKVFISANCNIICRSKITLSGTINIDRGVFIDALSVRGIYFGDNVSIGKYTTIECTGSLRELGYGLTVGNNVGMGTHGFWGCAGGIQIGNDTIFGNYVSLHAENHNFDDITIPIRKQGVNRKGIKIGNNCWIGAKVTILDGVSIEDGCIIAAGSVLKQGIYISNSIYGGVPAKFIKKRNK
jgi:acetyltransferase-like isoleucine patch superfamily enzyme